jgi:cobalt-zinc-cadmium resistance protein CzcA
MLNQILEFSLRQRMVILFFVFILMIVGLWSASKLPIDAVPDITNVQVQINTEVPALAPEEVEKLVSYPVEMEMSGLQGLIESRSLSKIGLSQVTLVFKDGTDIYRARQLVNERLQAVIDEIPQGLTPKLAPISTGLGEIYYYVVQYKKDYVSKLANEKEQLMELKQIQDFIIKPMLRTVSGVAEVNTSGGYEKQYLVLADPTKLKNAGMTYDELAEVLGENTENAGGGAIEIGGELVGIRSTGRLKTAQEIENVVLKYKGGSIPLKVKDVAKVEVGSSLRTGTSTYNGEEAVLGAVLMLADENSRTVAKGVHQKIEEIRTRLPEGVEIITVYNRTDLVEKTIRTVGLSLFEGSILVIAVLFFLLGNWRASLIVACAIPLSMLFAVTGMVQTKMSGNLMSLGAIDFGLIIDGAVVMVENILRRLGIKQHELGRELNYQDRWDEVLSSAKEVVSPMFFGVLIITVVYLPILGLTGVEGKMFKPMAITVMFALVGALILALTLIPVLCVYFLKGKVEEKENKFIGSVKKFYIPILDYAFKQKFMIFLGSAGLFLLSVILFVRMGGEFIPQLDEGSFATHMIRTTSIGMEESLSMQKRGEKLLLEKFPEVSHTFSRIGTAEIASDPMGLNVADTYIFFEDKVDKEEMANLMTKELAVHVPVEAHLFSQPIEMRFNEILEGTRADIAVKVFGDDFVVIEKIASELREILEKIPGAADVEFDALGKAPTFNIQPSQDALENYSIHSKEINDVLNSAIAGKEVGKIIEGNKRFDIIVRMPDSYRNDLEALKELPVRTEEGALVALGQVSDFKVEEQVAAITRESGERRAAIMINLRGRDVESFVKEAQEKIKEIEIPEGYRVEFGGQFKNLQEAKSRLMIIVPLALLVIFVLIYLSFGSIIQTFLIYLCIPLAMTGGVLALFLRGMTFTISAGVGFIALSGIAVLNGIMLVSFINKLREDGSSIEEAVIDGTLTRLRPMLMTALVASLGFVPMALSTGAGAEVQKPLATVVIGGIITSTFLMFILLPILYTSIEKWKTQQK